MIITMQGQRSCLSVTLMIHSVDMDAKNRVQIPWTIMIGPEFITEQGEITLREWIFEAQARIGALEKTKRIFLRNFGLNPLSESVFVPTPSYLTVSILGGAELVIPEDHNVMVKTHVLNSSSDVDRLSVPESIVEHPAMTPYVEQYHRLVADVGGRMSVSLAPGTQGPITMAKLLRGQDFFADLLEYPDKMHRLLEIVTETIIKAWREVREVENAPLRGEPVAIHDDFAGLMGPDLYAEFAIPCYQKIYHAFDPSLRLFHSELLRPGHLEKLEPLSIDFLNLGENQYMRPSVVKSATDISFEWHVKTATLGQGTPEMVKSEFEFYVNDGAPAMLTELCARNIPFENIHTYIETAEEHGPFVSPGGCYIAAMSTEDEF